MKESEFIKGVYQVHILVFVESKIKKNMLSPVFNQKLKDITAYQNLSLV